MLLTLWNIIAPVLFCAGLGYFWARAGKPFDTQMVTSLVTTVTTPCLIVATLGKTDLDMAALTQVAGAAVAVMLDTLFADPAFKNSTEALCGFDGDACSRANAVAVQACTGVLFVVVAMAAHCCASCRCCPATSFSRITARRWSRASTRRWRGCWRTRRSWPSASRWAS